ncbi:sugar ABC transporter ATP-binding protein [Thermogemmatispora carboxidivorans]|uniref:sugar ABC transporter ATP-binding protein n=1 Tax=Thermogemmatispora carboxidivorans TaxID=1382306 RepID=UPI00069AEFA5|nr:sugar ABC transporter ATP-binding protein [Thermogemmatispora carboxidivorans]
MSTKEHGAGAPLVELRQVTKVYPNGTVAMRGVNLRIHPHSIHGLVGANGAGKSTLIKILAGALEASSGEILWKGQRVRWRTPADARTAGVAAIYQHIPLVPTLSVLDNLLLGRRGWWRTERRHLAEIERLLSRVGYTIDPLVPVSELSIGQRQMVAILQALMRGAELVIMDEPTASLAQSERELVFRLVRQLCREGQTTFLYVSHFLEEVLHLTDRVTVLRDGQVVAEMETATLSEEQLIEAMVGKKLLSRRSGPPSGGQEAPILLEVAHLHSPNKVKDVSFTVRSGEIVGLAGFLSSGRSEILHAIFGADAEARGLVRVAGRPVPRSPVGAVRAGLALVPEDRTRQGLIRDWPIWRNISLPDLAHLATAGLIPRWEREQERALRAMSALRIVAPSTAVPVDSLSGGNAQKVVFAKWMYGPVKVFLLDEPTVGVDVGAKAEILELIRRFAREGKAVVLVSSEFEELLAVAQRILVVHQGRIVAERLAAETSEDELVRLASGLARERQSSGATPLEDEG